MKPIQSTFACGSMEANSTSWQHNRWSSSEGK